MPQVYEQIKAEQISKGKTEKDAKTAASKIYNALRRRKPSMPKLSNKPDKKSMSQPNQ